jgi:GT2 family glycosyltransferase
VQVSIVIAARDEDPQVLEATLAGLDATTRHLSTDIIVVDDGSLTPLNCGKRQVRLIRHQQALGACQARRVGAMVATGDVLVWIDAHMSFGENWLEQMLVHINPSVVLCSPFCTYDTRESMCWGADFVWSDTRDYRVQKIPGLGFRHRTETPDQPMVEVPMVIGACYMMQRDAYLQMGGFSPHFKIWGNEEQDMSARAWMSGMRIACATRARVGHLSRQAFPYPVQFDHLEFNQMVMLRCLLERATLERLEPQFHPLPPVVADWLAQTTYDPWRKATQRRRKISDAEFFRRFLPALDMSSG